MLGGSADAETVATVTRALEETQDTLATFTKLVLKEAASQDEEKKKARSLGEGIAVTDNACTPG